MDVTPVGAVLETDKEPSASEIVVDETVQATVAAVTQKRLSESHGKGSPFDDEVKFNRPAHAQSKARVATRSNRISKKRKRPGCS